MNNFKYINKNTVLGFGNDILKNILKSRGIKDVDKFLNLDDSVIEDYNLYDNILYVSQLYLNTIDNEETIGILVDFDTDGFTSGAELFKYTKEVCKYLNKQFKCEYILHSKKSHGLDDIDVFNKLLNYDLIIIPDAGSNDFKQLIHLKNIDKKYIILDHHQGNKEKLIKYNLYDTIVNNQLSENITNKAMTGVGVTYKFMKCVDNLLKINLADKFLDLVAIGLIGDSADLRDLESRYLTQKGMNLIKSNNGCCKLLNLIYKNKSYSMNNKITITGIAFYMIPAINCIIRGGTNEEREILFKGLIGDNSTTYIDKVKGKGDIEFNVEEYVIRLYDKLKRKQDKIVSESVEILNKQIKNFNLDKQEIIVVNGNELEDSTYNRVIVNQLCSKYRKHTILLKHYYKNIYGGSASGFKNKEIKDLRSWSNNTGLFLLAEGHPMAFGVKITLENIQKLYTIINKLKSTEYLTYEVDGEYTKDTLNPSIIKTIASYEDIWGNKLDEPLFAIKDIIINSSNVDIKGKSKNTLKFSYKGITFIKFKSSEDEFKEIIKNENNKFTFIGKFKINEYYGNIYPQIVIEDYYFNKTNEVETFQF